MGGMDKRVREMGVGRWALVVESGLVARHLVCCKKKKENWGEMAVLFEKSGSRRILGDRSWQCISLLRIRLDD